MMFSRFILLLALAGSLSLVGCTEKRVEPVRVPVSGSVTLDGKPLDKGIIYFKTIATGSVDTMNIADGKFSGEAEPGKRRVEISAFRAGAGATPGMDAGEVNYIPAKYNTQQQVGGGRRGRQSQRFQL